MNLRPLCCSGGFDERKHLVDEALTNAGGQLGHPQWPTAYWCSKMSGTSPSF